MQGVESTRLRLQLVLQVLVDKFEVCLASVHPAVHVRKK